MPSRVFRIVALRQTMSAALGFILLTSPGRALASQAQADAKTGSLQIDVVDPSGAAIARAEIQIQLRPQGPVQKFAADEKGKLSVDLQPGGYDVLVSSPGFRHETREIEVQEASRQELSVTLAIGSYSGPKVSYSVSAIETTAAPLPELIGGCTGQEQIAELQPTDPAYA
ncbi:MAG: carboxypeptidase-like regulatory domain-containing protein, partial [Candidatus Acidiferrales bacterium]